MVQANRSLQDPESPTKVGRDSPGLHPQDSTVAEMLQAENIKENTVFKADGTLDAKAFKKMIFEKQAGSMTGPKN